MSTSSLGWMATAMSAASYLFRQPAALRKMQAAGACLGIIYGITNGAMPVAVANLIVAVAALLSTYRGKSAWTEQWSARLNRQSGRNGMAQVPEGR
jgi:hypothetical protein